MIVDVHTHVPTASGLVDAAPMRPDQPNPTGITEDDYMRGLGPAEVAICFNIAAPPPGDPSPDTGFTKQAREVNDATAAFVRKHPERLIGFLTVHPRQSDVLDEIDRAAKDLGLRGIKLGANYQNFDPVGDDAFVVYR